MIVKMAILRLLGSSDDKEKIGVARPEVEPVQQTQRRPNQQSTPVEPTLVSEASVQLSRDSIFGGF